MSSQISIRLPPTLRVQVQREAAERGMNLSNRIAHLVERGHLAESLEDLLPRNGHPAAPAESPAKASGTVPPQIVERVLFAACFSEALLKKLNASLNRSSSELGLVAQQARDMAQSETASLLRLLRG
ncbi:MAG: hypothetical protein P4L83_07770 [Nevskia sp.]|nr:hypothetical protein [Nevskia sp.]